MESNPVKRTRGRPKGTKNKPDAHNVGRPRKDGGPPRKRKRGNESDDEGFDAEQVSRQRSGTASLPNVEHDGPLVASEPTSSRAAPSTPSFSTAPDSSPMEVNYQGNDASSASRISERAASHAHYVEARSVGAASAATNERYPITYRQLTLSFGRPTPSTETKHGHKQGQSGHATGHNTGDSQDDNAARAPLAIPQELVTSERTDSAPTTQIHASSARDETTLPRRSVGTTAAATSTAQSTQISHESGHQTRPAVAAPSEVLSVTVATASPAVGLRFRSLPLKDSLNILELMDNPYGSDLANHQNTAGPSTSANDDANEGDETVSADDDDPELDREFQADRDDDEAGSFDQSCMGNPLGASHSGGTPRSSMPSWLEDDYARIRQQLNEEMSRNKKGLPSCYERYSFFENAAAPGLIMRDKIRLHPGHFWQPTFFVWLPHLLVTGARIPCPTCIDNGTPTTAKPCLLQKSGWVDKPRRITDIDQTVYLIGYRYYCGTCQHKFRSWSPAVLKSLPKSVSAQFPFRLTYRNGLTHTLAALLRESFRGGIGPKPFMQMIQALHYQHYDSLRVQYLEMVAERRNIISSGFLARMMRFGTFSDRDGYAGFVPSANYFRRFYDVMIEEAAPEMRQLMALLPARILKIDHSHKAPARTGKVAGVRVWTALHTSVNEMGDIRAMTLTPTKAHDQFMPVLAKIPISLKLYGHDEVEAIWTDAVRTDKRELERIFPSLLKDVEPVSETSLATLTLPSGWNHVHLRSANQVNTRFNVLMENTQQESEELVVGLDMEWPVDLTSGLHGPIALIQVAHQNTVYLIQTCFFLKDGIICLPSAFLAFLRTSTIKKVGVSINADLKRLHRDCKFTEDDPPFVGAVELGPLAKACGLTNRKNESLEGLVRLALKQHLIKDQTIRVSTAWVNKDLHQDFINYAVLDAYAVIAVYNKLRATPSITPVSESTPAGTAVALCATDGRPVAQGVISTDPPNTHDGVNITKSRVLITVSKILVPGYLVLPSLLRHNEMKALSVFGPPPFQLLCYRRNLHTLPSLDGDMDSQIITPCPPPTTGDNESTETSVPEGTTSPEPDDEASFPDTEPLSLMDAVALDPTLPEQDYKSSRSDPSAYIHACDLLQRYSNIDLTSLPSVRSRVIGDIWHLHDQFPISINHGLRRPFARALSLAIFIPDAEDKAAVEVVLKKKDSAASYDAKLRSDPSWVLRRVRRFVPPPELLLPRVAAVIHSFGPLQDATTHQALFSERAWEIADNVLDNIKLGYYSDPPGVQLYYETGHDRNGLTMYRCCRGTNDVEGGVHQNLIRCFNSFNISPRHAVNLLLDYAVGHNMRTGTKNRINFEYTGHYDVSLKNHVAQLLDSVADLFAEGAADCDSWVNGNAYVQADEMFGIMPFSPSLRESLRMLPYDKDLSIALKLRHDYLGTQQGTMFAVLPVHSRAEKSLYHAMLSTSSFFAGRSQPNWLEICKEWSGHCDGKDIFYKLPEHLKSYFKTWNDYCNERNSVNLYVDASKQLRSLLLPIPPSVPSIQASKPGLLRDQLNPPTEIMENSEAAWRVHVGNVIAEHLLQKRAAQVIFVNTRAESETVRSGQGQDASLVQRAKSKGKSAEKASNKRAERTCIHCKSKVCPGRWSVNRCPGFIKRLQEEAIANARAQNDGRLE